MALKQASWAHGNVAQLEGDALHVNYRGFWATITPRSSSPGSGGGYVHIPIPIPPIINGTRLKADFGHIRFITGTKAHIAEIHVFDGERRFERKTGLDWKGALQTKRFEITGSPEVIWGVGITLVISFTMPPVGRGAPAADLSDCWIGIVSAGIEFV